MPRYLITLSIGPVQSLIDAARRTRDLWCGSWLLSELSRAAARSLDQAQPGCLIFPSLANPEQDLRPVSRPGDQANIANVLRACVDRPDALSVQQLCGEASEAARERLRVIGREVLDGTRIPLRGGLWDAQLSDLLEIQAAWVEWAHVDASAPESTYAHASKAVGQVLAARKSTRDFAQVHSAIGTGLPKSSLDGAAETVLMSDVHSDRRARRELGLSSGEQLDALGVIKRRAGDVEQFTAWSRIAVDPWIQQLQQTRPELLAELRQCYEPLVGLQLATRTRGNQDTYDDFPYDGQLLFDFRIQAALAGSEIGIMGDEEREALKALQHPVRKATRLIGAPVPYAAILKADGDHMGALLQKARTLADSRRISEHLHRFASTVGQIVRTHRGHAIYAGGDDVLALVPLPQAVACARALAGDFAKIMSEVAEEIGVDRDAGPTLSVGVGIGHIMEPLGRLRERAARAEHRAKHLAGQPPRNALAILLGIRSGGELAWRAQWSRSQAFQALNDFGEAYVAGQLSSRVAYDLRAIDLRFRALSRLTRDSSDETEESRGMQMAEVVRMLERARRQGGAEPLSGAMRERIQEEMTRQSLAELADTLILARWLAARNAADLGDVYR